MGEKTNVHRILVGTAEGQRSLEGPSHRRGINLAQDRDQWKDLVNAILKLWFPYNVEEFLTI
jgi:hypothetical protein